jgi:hypothetical protein
MLDKARNEPLSSSRVGLFRVMRWCAIAAHLALECCRNFCPADVAESLYDITSFFASSSVQVPLAVVATCSATCLCIGSSYQVAHQMWLFFSCSPGFSSMHRWAAGLSGSEPGSRVRTLLTWFSFQDLLICTNHKSSRRP